MKKTLTLFFIITGFISCSSISDIHTFQKSSQNTLEVGKNEFVELNNGTLIEGVIQEDNIVKHFKAFGNGSIKINEKKYPESRIKTFQNKTDYYARVNEDNFGERIIQGKINLYTLNHLNNLSKGSAFNLNFIQKGEEAQIKKFTISTFEKMIKDNIQSLEELHKYKKLSSKQQIKEGDFYLNKAISIYNSNT